MKTFTLLLVSILTSFITFSQYQKNFGNTGNDVCNAMIRTSDGGYMLAGDTYSFGLSKSDVLLVKLDATGAIQWSKSFGGADYDHANNVIQTRDGGYAVCGVSGSNNGRVSLVKLNASGTVQWSKYYSANTRQSAAVVVQTGDGGYALAGQLSTYNNGSWGYLIRTDSTGGLLWSKTIFARNFYPEIRKMIITNDGGFALLANFPSPSYYDIYFIKPSAAGAFEWARSIGGSSTDFPAFLMQSSDEGYVFGGMSFSYSTPIQQDLFAVKIDKDGNQLWAKTIGSQTRSESGSSITEAPDKSYVILGITDSSSNLNTSPYLVRLNKNGRVLETKVLTVTTSTYTNTISNVSAAGIAISGTSGSLYNNSQEFYLAALNRNGNTCGSYTTLDYSKDTGTIVVQTVPVANAPTTEINGGEVTIDRKISVTDICASSFFAGNANHEYINKRSNALSIYPNPAKDFITIINKNSSQPVLSAEVYNADGMKVMQVEKTNLSTMNISSLKNGMYLMKLRTAEGEVALRFLKAE